MFRRSTTISELVTVTMQCELPCSTHTHTHPGRLDNEWLPAEREGWKGKTTNTDRVLWWLLLPRSTNQTPGNVKGNICHREERREERKRFLDRLRGNNNLTLAGNCREREELFCSCVELVKQRKYRGWLREMTSTREERRQSSVNLALVAGFEQREPVSKKPLH